MTKIKNFVINNGVLKKYRGKDCDIVIPDSVTVINDRTFKNSKSLKSVVFSQNVRVIGYEAFCGCKALTNITIPEGITKIGESAFEDCSSLTKVVFHEGVKEIGKSSFAYCSSLTEVTLPESISTIGASAFLCCGELTIVNILGDTSGIEDLAFNHCNNLKYIFAPRLSIEYLKANKLMFPATMGYLTKSELYTDNSIIEGYKKYISSQKKKILPFVFAEDLVQGLKIFLEMFEVPKKDFEEMFLEPAMSANAIQCVAFLLEYKNQKYPEYSAFEKFVLN